MNYQIRKPWDIPESRHTPIDVYRHRKQHRREFLRAMGIAAAGLGTAALFPGCGKPTTEEIERAGAAPPLPAAAAGQYPAKRNDAFEFGRPQTPKREALEYTNFYEFATSKDSWKRVGGFKPTPWTVEVTGLCAQPMTLDLDDIHAKMKLEERDYRHRCVETWAMCVPWTGFPLRDLIKMVEPLPAAKFVELQTFYRPDEAPGIASHPSFPWPYTEGLTMDEATNELTLLATGLYGEPLARQNGAPIRLVTPWKYGFKSIKSIVQIKLTAEQPRTFWNSEWPAAYDFTANVDPEVDHPSWSQKSEWMLGSRERHETVKYNGYGEYVAALYQS